MEFCNPYLLTRGGLGLEYPELEQMLCLLGLVGLKPRPAPFELVEIRVAALEVMEDVTGIEGCLR